MTDHELPRHHITIAFDPDADLSALGDYAFHAGFNMAERARQPFGSFIVRPVEHVVQFDWKAPTRADAITAAVQYLQELTGLPARGGSDPQWDSLGERGRRPSGEADR